MTVTLAAPKIPLVLPPADRAPGDLVIADIGIPAPIIDELEGPYLELLTRERMRELLPTRAAGIAQGRLRPRPDRRRIARARPAPRTSPRWRAALRRRARDRRDAAQRACRSSRRWAPST